MSMTVSGAKAGWVPLSCRKVLACVLGTCLVLAGCAGTAPAQLTTFNRLGGSNPAGLQGLRFVVEPQSGQVDSLAFADYAERVRKALGRHGLVPISDSRQANLIVHLDYSSDGDPSAGQPTSGSRISLGLGGGMNVGWGIGLGLPVGGRSDGLHYRHRLQVVMDRVQAGGDGAGVHRHPPERVYESTLLTMSESAASAPLMPAMIDAILTHFPGDNGKTLAVSLPAS